MGKISIENYENGFYEFDINSVDEFINLIRDNDNFEGHIFRGQGNSEWGLNSSYARECISANEGNVFYERAALLDKFRKAIRGRIPVSNTDSLSYFEVWAIGQHHGLKTPLLDWTASPFVSLFFAFKYMDINAESISIWFFDARKLNWLRCKKVHDLTSKHLPQVFNEPVLDKDWITNHIGAEEEIFAKVSNIASGLESRNDSITKDCQKILKVVDESIPLIISPSLGENSRIVNQRGLFTYSHLDFELKKWVVNSCRNDDFPFQNSSLLTKTNISKNLKNEYLSMLDAMNINYLSLFPDLFGSSMFCNEKIKFGI